MNPIELVIVSDYPAKITKSILDGEWSAQLWKLVGFLLYCGCSQPEVLLAVRSIKVAHLGDLLHQTKNGDRWYQNCLDKKFKVGNKRGGAHEKPNPA